MAVPYHARGSSPRTAGNFGGEGTLERFASRFAELTSEDASEEAMLEAAE
jgi:hypothetical protein